MYYREPRSPEAQDLELIKSATHLVGVAIERDRAKRALRRSEAYLTEAQRLSHTGSFGWRPDTGEIIWSDETYRIFEYDRAEKPTLNMVFQRIHPDDRRACTTGYRRRHPGAQTSNRNIVWLCQVGKSSTSTCEVTLFPIHPATSKLSGR